MDQLLRKSKKIVLLFSKSIPLLEQLVERTGLTLINDIKIRWNYTLLMIDRYLNTYDDVLHIITNSSKHNSSHSKYLLVTEEINVLNCLKQLLKPFYTVTQILGGEQYSTLDLVLNSTLYIRRKITNLEFQENSTAWILKKLLLESFEFYIEKYNVLNNSTYMGAAILSPRFKSFQYATDEEKKKIFK